MDRFEAWLTKVLTWICITIMGLMTLLVITSVILRYIFSISYTWTEEFITFLFLATTYFGVILGIKENEHITIDFLVEKLEGKGKKILTIFIGFVVLFVQVVVFNASIQWIKMVGNTISQGTRIPIKYVYYMMPLNCVLVGIYEVIKMIKCFKFKEKAVSPM